MKVLLTLITSAVLLLTISAFPAEHPNQKQDTNSNVAKAAETDKAESTDHQETEIENKNNSATITPETGNSTANSTAPDPVCSALHTAFASSGLPQECDAHTDCLGACCSVELLAHKMTYNFTVRPCDPPEVDITFNITDIDGAELNETYSETKHMTIPAGNMSWAGVYETESSVDIEIDQDKVLQITHFKLDFGVQYRVLKNDPLKSLFTHTLIPRLSLQYNKDVCVKPTTAPPQHITDPIPMSNGGDNDKILGIIPQDYVKDKTKLALVGTIVGLAVVVLIGIIYFIVTRRRANGAFYRTYVSTDENRHLTKGNDGFEPLDDSDID